MWEKAVKESDASEMMADLPGRTTSKFKKLYADSDWKQRYDTVDEKFRQLVRDSSS